MNYALWSLQITTTFVNGLPAVTHLCNRIGQKCEGERAAGEMMDLISHITLSTYCHSFIVCNPLVCHHISSASAHILFPSLTYFHSDCGCHHTAQICMRNTKKLGQILHAAQITLEDRTLSVLIAHPAHRVCFVCPVGVFEPHISPVS